jgi:zinc protease
MQQQPQEKEIKTELENIAKNGISDKELSRAKNQWAASQTYQKDSIYSQAMQIGYMEMSGISYTHQPKIIEKIKSVTSNQVKTVVAKYFTDDRLTVATLQPLPLNTKPIINKPAGLHH